MKKYGWIISLVLLLGLLTSCGGGTQPQQAVEGGITVTDMIGRTVTLDKPADRIVALTAGDCEIVCALGAGELLVGRGAYCDWPEEILDVPVVESGKETNLEQILALQPQVLVMADMEQSDEQVAALESAGVKVVVSDAHSIEETYEAIRLLGTLLGKDAEAEAMVLDMQTVFSEIRENADGDGGKTVYFEVSPLEYGLWTAGNNTFMNEVANMMGLTNLFADLDGWVAISEEQVLARDPDYIVTVSMFYGEGPTPVEEIMGRGGWENVTAVKDRAILNLQNNELSRPAHRLAEGAQRMYEFVYENK